MRSRACRRPTLTTHSRRIERFDQGQCMTAARGGWSSTSCWSASRGHRPRARGQHLHAVVGNVEKHVLEVDRVARNAHCQDLPRPLASDLLTIGVAVDEDRTGAGIALADEIAPASSRRTRAGRSRTAWRSSADSGITGPAPLRSREGWLSADNRSSRSQKGGSASNSPATEARLLPR